MHSNRHRHFRGLPWQLILMVLVVSFALPKISPAKVLLIRGDHNYPPFEYLNDKKEPEGFNIEITRAIAREMGIEIKIDLGPWSQIRSELENGKIDVLMGMFNTPDRDRLVDFSIPHFIASYAVFVRKGSSIKSLDDAQGKSIIVQKADLGHDYIVKNRITEHILLQTDISDALALLSSGKGDCAVVSRLQGLILKKEKKLKNIVAVGPPMIQRKYCLAVTEGNSSLLAKLNEGLSILKTSGEYDQIYEKWYGVRASGFPRWIKSLFQAAAALLAVAVLIIFVSRAQVKRKTQELEQKNLAILENETRLKAMKDFSDHLINSLPGIFFLYQYENGQFYLKKWNSSHENALGFSAEELEKADMRSFFSEDDMERLNQFTLQLFKAGSLKAEMELLNKENQSIPFIFQAELFEQDHEQFIIGTGIEISDQKKAEKDKKDLEKRLQQTQKMEAIGTLAGGIAHDFNNILSAIIGYAELTQMTVPEAKKASENLEKIIKAGNRAKDLVQQILTFSRQTDKELKPLSVKVIANEALKLIRASLPSTVHIKKNLVSDSVVMGDATEIHQILMNLCSNAGQAMQESGGTLEVILTDETLSAASASTYTDIKPGAYLKLTIKDTGHGIPPDKIDRIFDPFFTTKEKGQGTGLGLSVVHGIVKSCKGTISVSSALGSGTAFEILLPTTENYAQPVQNARKFFPEGSEKILFVDDEPELAEIGKDMLENLGYRVFTETDPQKALALFLDDPQTYDLIITDMTMPVMTGEKLAEKIMAVRPDIPIMLLTGFSFGMSEAKAREAGIKGFLMKPISRFELVTMVRELLDT